MAQQGPSMTTKKFVVSFRCDGAAFEGDNERTEIARCLMDIAAKVERGEWIEKHRNVLDENGNIIGTFVLKEEA
jgi:hypothetical protein